MRFQLRSRLVLLVTGLHPHAGLSIYESLVGELRQWASANYTDVTSFKLTSRMPEKIIARRMPEKVVALQHNLYMNFARQSSASAAAQCDYSCSQNLSMIL